MVVTFPFLTLRAISLGVKPSAIPFRMTASSLIFSRFDTPD